MALRSPANAGWELLVTGVNHTKVILDIRSARTYHTVIFLKNIYDGIIKKGKEINSGVGTK